jgi:hypothetical protein
MPNVISRNYATEVKNTDLHGEMSGRIELS